MNQYMLLLHENPSAFATISPQEMQAIIGKYQDWSMQLEKQEQLISSIKLSDEGGRHVHRDDQGLHVMDGPYAEAKELIGGYFIVQAKDYQEAVKISSSCPHLEFGRIEVRLVDQMGKE